MFGTTLVSFWYLVNSCVSKDDALPNPESNPLEGPTMLSYGKLGLEGRSRLPALKRGRGAC